MSTKTAPKPITVALKDVSIDADHNPRHVDEKSEAFLELVGSVKEFGILQPILLGERTNGSYPVIAGERRVLAARKAKLKEIPALEAPGLKGSELAAALTENVVREDLTPIEEARAIQWLQEQESLTQPDAGKRLHRSERWVRDRLRLLKLPDKTRDAFSAGEIPLEAMPKVEKIATQAPAVSDALVDHIRQSESSYRPGDLLQDYGITEIVAEVVSDQGLGLPMPNGYEPADLPVPDRAKKKLQAEIDSKVGPQEGYAYRGRIQFDEPAIDAARAFGCLLEIDGGSYADYYATDPEWIVDWAEKGIAELAKLKEKSGAEKAAKEKPAGERTEVERKAGDEEAERRRKEREREAKKRAAAHDTNTALGLGIFKGLARPKITPDIARLFALFILYGAGPQSRVRDLVGRGLTYVREDLHGVVESKNGSIKVEPVSPDFAVEKLVDELNKAKTVEAIFGVVLRALVAARFADPEVTVQSKRVAYNFPAESWLDAPPPFNEILPLINKIALDAGALPQPLIDRAEKAAKAFAEQEAKRREDERKMRDHEEVHVLKALDGLGGEAEIEAVSGKVNLAAHYVPEVVERLLDHRQVSWRGQPDGEDLLKLNPSGKKRLEKAK